MASKIGILGLGAYAPERVMSNEEWTRYVDTSDEWITARTGIKNRRFAAPHESTVDLALEAAREALANAGLAASDIGEIIVATDTPEVFSPDTAAFVQHRLGVGEVPAYDLSGSGCAGFVQALDIARSRVLSGSGRVLVIGVEVLSRMMDWQDRTTCVLFGDAAGAAIVGEVEEGGEIVAVVAGTDGSRTDILGLEVGGTRKPFNVEQAERRLRLSPPNPPGGAAAPVVMKGRKVFKEAVRRMSEASLQVLEKAGRSLEEVSLVVPHQANLRIIHAVAKALAVPLEKVFVNVRDFGNTGSASVPLALAQAFGEGRVRAGDLVLLTTFGAGFHWAAGLVQF